MREEGKDVFYAYAARAALELRLTDCDCDRLPAVLAEPETQDLIEQAATVQTTPAAFSEDRP